MRLCFCCALLIGLVFGTVPALAQMEDGYVLQTAGRLVFVDKGEQDNVRPGDLLQVVRQEVIRHPETGENLAGEVALGAIRIVEVFPRLSTAEVVRLNRGVTMELLDTEARQGLIRTKPLPPEAEMAIVQEVQARQSGMLAPPGQMNPDGILRRISPAISFGLGSRVEMALPVRTYQLIAPTAQLGGHLSGSGVSQPDSAFTGVSGTPLLTLADTSNAQDLGAFGPALRTHLNLTYPLSEQLTATVDFGFGSQSTLALGARFFAGRLLPFLDEGYTPDGKVGAPMVFLKLGRGGQGATSLPSESLAQLISRTDLQADSAYISVLDTLQLGPDVQAAADSLYRADVTRILRHAASDSLSDLSGRGLGFALGFTLPIHRHFSLHADWVRWGSAKEMGMSVTYYMRAVDQASPNANPDGRIRSLVITLGGRYDSGQSKTTIDLGLSMPLMQQFTLSGGFRTNFGGYNRFGLGLKGYLKGF